MTHHDDYKLTKEVLKDLVKAAPDLVRAMHNHAKLKQMNSTTSGDS